jgi:hypothetical protein
MPNGAADTGAAIHGHGRLATRFKKIAGRLVSLTIY